MYNELTMQLFERALTHATDIDSIPIKNQQLFTTDQYQLRLIITKQDQLLFQINAPVLMVAAMQLIKEEVDTSGFTNKDAQSIAEKLECSKIVRHQIEWVVNAYNQLIS